MYPSHPRMFISLLTSLNLFSSLDPKDNIQMDRRNLSFKSRTMQYVQPLDFTRETQQKTKLNQKTTFLIWGCSSASSSTQVKADMALVCSSQVKSKAGGHHAYNHTYKVKEELDCFYKPKNNFSENKIILKSNKILTEHVAKPLAEKITEKRRRAL